jgi:hypothetical protein
VQVSTALSSFVLLRPEDCGSDHRDAVTERQSKMPVGSQVGDVMPPMAALVQSSSVEGHVKRLLACDCTATLLGHDDIIRPRTPVRV